MKLLILLMNVLCMWVKDRQAELQGVITRYDLDGDNIISRDEFVDCCKAVLGETRRVAIKLMKNKVHTYMLLTCV